MTQAQQIERIPQQSGAIALTPMDIVDRALATGNVDAFTKAMDLYERWEKNQAAKEFNAAITAAKAEIKPVARNKSGHNNKRYADMAAVSNAVDSILSAHGLGYRYRSTQDDRIHVTCILFHRGGHSEETTLSGPADTSGNKNAIQAIGSTTTYLERYTLRLALGLAASDDDDGKAGGAGSTITDQQSDQINSLITETKTDINKFLKWAQAESVSDIKSSKFADALAFLNAKKANAKKTEPVS